MTEKLAYDFVEDIDPVLMSDQPLTIDQIMVALGMGADVGMFNHSSRATSLSIR